MRVPNQTTRILNMVFSPLQVRKHDSSALNLRDNEKLSIPGIFVQLPLLLLVLPAITILLLLWLS